jgi:hypothetical protein
MTTEERKEYAESIYDDLRMLVMLRRYEEENHMKQGDTWCVSCGEYFSGDPRKHLVKHIYDDLRGTSTPPPEFT